MSDILNNALRQQNPDSDSDKVAFDFLDKIFYLFPSYSGFTIEDIINNSDLSIHEKITAEYISSEMKNILNGEGCSVSTSKFGNLTLQLNSIGRDVKNAGGLSDYKTKPKHGMLPSITNYIHQGDNYGNVVNTGHESSLSHMDLEIKSVEQPIVTETTQNTGVLKNGAIKNIFSSPFIITIIGGLIIIFLAKLFG